MRRKSIFLALLLALTCAATASAQHNQIDLVSTGPTEGPGITVNYYGLGFSEDGARVFFTTDAPLVADDTDSSFDVYLREGGITTRLSAGTTGGNGAFDSVVAANTPDGEHVFFDTYESLQPEDGDIQRDIYEWSNGVLSLVSGRYTGPGGAAHEESTWPVIPSRDGSRVFFGSFDRLVAEDTDDEPDAYERSGGVTRLLSIGPTGGNGSGEVRVNAASEDGSRVFFTTTEALTADDPNTWQDVYRREGNATTRVTQGHFTGFLGITPDGNRFFFGTREALVPEDDDAGTCTHPLGCADIYEYSPAGPVLISSKSDGSGGVGGDAGWRGISDDGQRIFFETREQLAAEDTDQETDVYERSGATTTLVSTSATAGNAPTGSRFAGKSADGLRVFFMTSEAMIPEDTNGSTDVYERAGGVITQVSVGPSGSGATAASVSRDGTRVLFLSPNQLVPEDVDPNPDLFERAGGKTYLVTDFTTDLINGLHYVRGTPDLKHLFFHTVGALLPPDQDTQLDLYVARVGPAAGYPRPKGASPMRVPLVPAFAACTSPNRSHGAPLSFPSCAPPVQSSATLTVGTDDANGNGQRSIGSVTLKAIPGDPATEIDDADVTIRLSITDVRVADTLADYTGELQGRISIRLTDNGRSAPITNPPQTIQDFPLSFTAPCAATDLTTIGARCEVATAADALIPGMVREDHRNVWELGQVQVYDGGPDGDAETEDNTVFARQGIFVP
jgi:hypothetical protein